VLERERTALGERRDDRAEAAGGGTREEAAGLVGHGDVGEAGDVDVEDGAFLVLGGERADHAEGG
jgi:hypothetical protein